MKRRILFSVFVFFALLVQAQKSFNLQYEAMYTLEYKNFNRPNAKSQLTTFILMMNDKESYFKSMNLYVEDSLKYYKKLKETGDPLTDYTTFAKYDCEYPENIGTTSGKIYVTGPIATAYISYDEPNNIEWKVVNEFKNIGNARCQKAVTAKYGRNWIAYFNPKIPFNFGPYKFNKLPGLIMELYDEKDDFHYKLYKLKKRNEICPFANMYKNIKPAKKEKVYQWRKNSYMERDYSKILENGDPEMVRKLNRTSRQNGELYNPIELSPY